MLIIYIQFYLANRKTKYTSRKFTDSASSAEQISEKKNCMYCGVRYTPMWRRGPKGPGKLTNNRFIIIIMIFHRLK